MAQTILEVPADDSISLTLSKFKPEDLLNVIEGLKKVFDQDAAQGHAMLEANPDLTYAVLQAEFLMGMVDEEVVTEAMKSMPETAPVPPPVEPALVAPAAPAASAPAAPAAPAAPDAAPVAAAAADPFQNMPPEQVAMIRQVVAISEEQLSLLPPDQQTQVRALKQQYGL